MHGTIHMNPVLMYKLLAFFVSLIQTLPVMYDAVCVEAGVGPVGEVRLMPDWDTLRMLPYAKGHASVLANMYTIEGKPSDLCSRNFLKRMIDEAANSGLHVKAAFENEFNLLKPSEGGMGISPVDTTVYAATLSMDINHDIMMDIFDTLTQQGLEIEQYYPESAPGQQEISIAYTDAMNAANQQIAFRESVKAVAHKHQLVASFVPKIFPDKAGNGTHIHLSLHESDGTNITPSESNPNELSEIAKHFIAGMLEHLPALMAITVPSTNSYRRLQPCTWSGAYQVWGYANRESAIRVPMNPSLPNPTHFELKTADASANPYLALGAVIAAGLDGVCRKLSLPPPTQFDPSLLSEQELREKNIRFLPRNLGESVSELSMNKVLLDALRPPLAKALLAIRETEWKAMKEMTLEEEVQLLLQRY